MLKFRCQQCGQRVAVPSRHLGKLVTCSECGVQTHPLAEQIVGANARATASARAAAAAPKETTSAGAAAGTTTCDNCGSAIGRLQSVHSWNGHTVCGSCFPRLAGDSSLRAVVPAGLPGAAPGLVKRARLEPRGNFDGSAAVGKPLALELRERVLRALVVFLVASGALYGALTLLRDIAGLVAVAAVAVLALLSLYALFRGTLAARRGLARPATAIVPQRNV